MSSPDHDGLVNLPSVRRGRLTIHSQSVATALHVPTALKLPSVALYVVESTFKCGFDSYRAHHHISACYFTGGRYGMYRANNQHKKNTTGMCTINCSTP